MNRITTDKECVEKMLNALPFADNNAGLKETAILIRKLFEEKELLKESIAPFAALLDSNGVGEDEDDDEPYVVNCIITAGDMRRAYKLYNSQKGHK